MKTIISAVISITLLIGAPSMQSVWANQADTEQEAGVATDAQGRTCDFGTNHDECPNASNTMPQGSKADDGNDVSGFPLLPPGQPYGTCEEKGNDNHLACDVVNDTGSS
jgi:hypothetical protein